MKTKILAIIVPLLMVLSGVVVASNATDADTEQANQKDFTIGVPFYLNVNEGNYYNYNYTAVWKIGENVLFKREHSINENGVHNFDDTLTQDGVTSNNVIYKMTAHSNTGRYSVTTEQNGANTPSETTIDWTVFVTINGTNSPSSTVSISLKPTTDVSLNISFEEKEDETVFGGTFTKNAFYDEKVVATDNTTPIVDGEVYKNIKFYAIGLPAGLSMSADGHINGVAKEVVENKTVAVAVSYVKNGVPTIRTGQITVSVVEQSNIFSMYFNEKSVTDGGSVIVYQSSDSKTLHISPTNNTWQSMANVKIVDENGNVSQLVNDPIENRDDPVSYHDFSIPINGTGSYTVIVTYENAVQTFTLYVIPVADHLVADIIITGN